jgi:hypothetical protein
MANAPTLWTHLPNDKPRTAVHPRPVTSAQLTNETHHFIVWHPRRARADGVSEIGRREHSAQRDDRDGKKPEVPRHDETGELVEAEFRPLINAAFERHPPIQINHDRRLRNVEKQNGQQPKEKVCLSQFRRSPDPGRPDHKENLGENEIEQPQRLL